MPTIKDDLGRRVTVPLPVRRIVSLAPVATENCFAIGAGNLIVGVTTADGYPPQVKNLPKIGDFYIPAYERIFALRPDIVLIDSATITKEAADNVARKMHVPVYVQKSTSFEDVMRHIEQLGDLTGHIRQAKAVVAEMRRKADAAVRIVRGAKPVTVFVELDRSPLFAAGPRSFTDDIVKKAGGINIVKGDTAFPIYSKESLIAADPDFYIVPYGKDLAKAKAKPFTVPLDQLTAIKSGKVRYLPFDLIFLSTPRLADGLLLLAKTLHPAK